jgi:hypothetical protein
MGWQKYTVGGFMAERSYRDRFRRTVGNSASMTAAARAVVAPPLAHTWPRLRPGAGRRHVLPGRGASAKVASVFAEQFELHWGKLGYPWGEGQGNMGKDG